MVSVLNNNLIRTLDTLTSFACWIIRLHTVCCLLKLHWRVRKDSVNFVSSIVTMYFILGTIYSFSFCNSLYTENWMDSNHFILWSSRWITPSSFFDFCSRTVFTKSHFASHKDVDIVRVDCVTCNCVQKNVLHWLIKIA